MLDRVIADGLVVLHFGFIVYVGLGGLLVAKYRWTFLLHAPAVAWGTLLEFRGWYCPLTSWENEFRRAANQSGYSGGFIEHYLIPLIYPPGLTADIQLIIGMLAVAVNVLIYSYVLLTIWRNRRRLLAEEKIDQ